MMEPCVVEADDDLENMPASVMEDISCELNQNNAWLGLAKNLKDGLDRRVLSEESLSRMRKSSSPGRELINVLMKNLLRVNDLQNLLKGCELYNILKLINTNEPAKILFPEKDSEHSVKLGSKITLPVEVCGSPYPDLQWYHNGRPLKGETSLELDLVNFSLMDAGEYMCRVKQRLNGVVLELDSPKYIFCASDSPPEILKDLEDVEIKAYEDLKLSFEVSGYPQPQRFVWFRNNRSILKTAIPQLIRAAADVHSSGEYHCEAFNRAGSCTTRRALVKVKEPVMCPEKPEIIEEPNISQEYFVETQMCLSWEVLCSKPVEITCFLNNEMLDKSSSVHDITQSMSRNCYRCDLKYHLTRKQMDKENWQPLVFKCEASSPGGRVLSRDVHVKVKTKDVKETYYAKNKWALLIANSNYRQGNELPGAKNDIRIIQKTFVELGFRVFMLMNLTRMEIQNAVLLFSTFVQKGDYVSFFYAGHGIHNEGKDYIMPLDAIIKESSKSQNVCSERVESSISIDECISYVRIANILQKSEPALIFSIYDTCRKMTPRHVGWQPLTPEDTYQTALKNSFIIFATSESYAAYEKKGVDVSLLVDTLQTLMTHKISVSDLAMEVLKKFEAPSESDLDGQKPQVPKICGDLALPRSLTDPCLPPKSDADFAVLKQWENLGGLGGKVQDTIALPDTNIKASVCWKGEPRRDGVTWVISNCLLVSVDLSCERLQDLREMDVMISLSTWHNKVPKKVREFPAEFEVCHLQEFEKCLEIVLNFTYRGQVYEKRLHLESPALSQKFYRGNIM